VQRIVEIGDRLVIGPAALRFLSREDRIIDGFFRFVAATEMQCQQFRDFVAATAVKLLERVTDGTVIEAAMPLEQAAIRGLLGQGVTKYIDRPLGSNSRRISSRKWSSADP